MSPVRFSLALVVATALVALVGCTAAVVRLPDGFSSHNISFDVSGYSPRRFNQPLRFGPYSALEMRDGGTFGASIPLPKVDLNGSWRPYAFTQTTPGQPPVDVQCRSTALSVEHGGDSRRLAIDLNAIIGPFVVCGLRLGNEPTGAFELSRDGVRMRGMLESANGDYEVRSIHAIAGSALPSSVPTGIEFLRNGKVLAVVDLLNAGRVHMGLELDERQRIYLAAAASSVLMLGMEIDD